MFLTNVPWQDILNLLSALGAVIWLVGSAVDVARKARGGHDRKHDDEDEG